MWLQLLAITSIGLNILSSLARGKAKARSQRYKASLAEENAKRADILYTHRAEKIRQEGLLDAGLFQMRAELSGLAGVSRDLWVGQRYKEVERGAELAEVSRAETVNRFLTEANWLKGNAKNVESSAFYSYSASGQVLAEGARLFQ